MSDQQIIELITARIIELKVEVERRKSMPPKRYQDVLIEETLKTNLKILFNLDKDAVNRFRH